MNKVYLLEYNGYYIGGEMLLVADTKRKAFNDAIKKLKELNLDVKNSNLTIVDLQEIATTKRDVIIINDGDY